MSTAFFAQAGIFSIDPQPQAGWAPAFHNQLINHFENTLSATRLHWIAMPVFLEPPQHDPRGVDGQGHNRMALLGTMHDECTLRPTSEATFWDSHDTRKARYGNYGPCTNGGRCESCKRYRNTTPWQWGGDELVVRVDGDGYPWIMNRPDDGWGEFGMRVTWEYLLRVEAEFSRGRDQHGPTIVMRKSA